MIHVPGGDTSQNIQGYKVATWIICSTYYPETKKHKALFLASSVERLRHASDKFSSGENVEHVFGKCKRIVETYFDRVKNVSDYLVKELYYLTAGLVDCADDSPALACQSPQHLHHTGSHEAVQA